MNVVGAISVRGTQSLRESTSSHASVVQVTLCHTCVMDCVYLPGVHFDTAAAAAADDDDDDDDVCVCVCV